MPYISIASQVTGLFLYALISAVFLIIFGFLFRVLFPKKHSRYREGL
mgnify:CR=1 FL=1